MERETAAVARRGLPAGAASRAFSLSDLAHALLDPHPNSLVYVYLDSSGRLATSEEGGEARAVVHARLAPHPPAATAALLLAPAPGGGGGGAWRLRLAVTRALAPHDELLLWPEPALLALCAVPFLTPLNIREDLQYSCHVCGARFPQPNPLKLHLLLGCGAPDPPAFWRALLARLARLPPLATLPLPETPSPTRSTVSLLSWNGCISRSPESTATAAAAGGGHACLYCGKLYSRRYGLKIHIRTHTGYKPLRCAHCARRFGDPSNLNKHVRLHARAAGGTGPAPPHACPHCGAHHARRRDLQRHLRARHPAPSPAPAPALPAG